MTAVIVAPRREGATSAEDVVTGGYFQYRPSRPYAAGGQWVQDIWTDPIALSGSAVTVDMDALADIPYELYLNMPDGRNGRLERSEFRTVTASGVALKWEDLVLANGPGAAPVIPSDLASRVAALEAAILTVSGGASNLAGISDMSAPARTFNAQGSYSAMRTTLGAGTSSLVIGTTGGTAGDGAVLTSTTTAAATATSNAASATSAAASATSAAAAATAAVAAKANLSSGTHPVAEVVAGATLNVFCPSDVMGTRPTTRLDIRVVWFKATAPDGGGYPKAEARDGWVVWDG